MTAEECPDAARHTPVPDGYLARAADAERRTALGQRQTQCPACKLWTIWRTRSGRRARRLRRSGP